MYLSRSRSQYGCLLQVEVDVSAFLAADTRLDPAFGVEAFAVRQGRTDGLQLGYTSRVRHKQVLRRRGGEGRGGEGRGGEGRGERREAIV